MKNNINLIPVRANDHWEIGLVERLIRITKQVLACIKKADKKSKSSTLKAALKFILYDLRICEHKTTEISFFDYHFGRRANTPLSNISTIPNGSDLSYYKILNHLQGNAIKKHLQGDARSTNTRAKWE